MADRSIDIRERDQDQTELLETVVDTVLSRLPKNGPVILSEDSKDGHTAQLQPTSKATYRKPDGTMAEVALPIIPDVPVYYASGSGITTTFGQKKGQEGFNISMALGIDGWHQQGGVQSPGEPRQHALWDTVFIPGIRSDPNKLKGVSPDSTQTRTDDKKSLHDISHTAITTIREFAVQQVNGAAIQSELKGARHVIDPKSILTLASKILLNC